MYIIVLAWIYVALMMAVAEATNTTGTVLGAIITFVLYGVGPVALLMYFMNRGRRRSASGEPDGSRQAPADPVPPVREEP